jgi:N6-L-threonylcarbamoyladenine synthase
MIILGIETSCDETAAAIVDGERNIRANLVLSQLKEHEAFGGVVPEIAARAHLDHLNTLIKAALDEAKITFDDLDGVAATCGPGLIGGLLVGMMAGKAIAAAKEIPFLAVNHLEGHALTPRLIDDVEFPYLLLLVSGGHTQLLVAEGVGKYKRWGTTLDDAAGECFDKSAKLMGLPWPGGPHIEKLAAKCKDPAVALKRFELPRPMQYRKEPDFSFSGLKTAMRNHVESLPEGALTEKDAADLAFALQTAIAEVLADRTKVALEKFRHIYKVKTPSLVVSGGVAANMAVRGALEKLDAKLFAPPLHLCSDNAAMIAWAGLERLRAGLSDSLDFKVKPRWPLDPEAEPRQGAGVKA